MAKNRNRAICQGCGKQFRLPRNADRGPSIRCVQCRELKKLAKAAGGAK